MTRQDWFAIHGEVESKVIHLAKELKKEKIRLECFEAVKPVYERHGEDDPYTCTGNGRDSILRSIEYNKVWLERWQALEQLARQEMIRLDGEMKGPERVAQKVARGNTDQDDARLDSLAAARRRYWEGGE